MTQHADQLLAAFAHFFPGAATIGSYIDGELVAGQGDTIQLDDAATGEATLAYRDAGAAVVYHAAESARRACSAMRSSSARSRWPVGSRSAWPT